MHEAKNTRESMKDLRDTTDFRQQEIRLELHSIANELHSIADSLKALNEWLDDCSCDTQHGTFLCVAGNVSTD